jgi:8-oxo-dGTP diphosphatase
MNVAVIKVTCAVIRNEDDEILVVQRGLATDHPLKWEFPGGKIHENETEEECVIREVNEELSMEVVICGKLPPVAYDYGHKQIELIPFICDTLDELPFLSEHNAYKWLSVNSLKTVDFSEADVFVAESYLERTKSDVVPGEKNQTHAQAEEVDEAELKSMINGIMSIKVAEWIATSAIENPAIFLKLFEYSYSSDKKLAFHSSWALTKVCDKYPEIIYPYLTEMVGNLNKIDNESALRSFLRIISLADISRINSSMHGVLADSCFNNLKSGLSAIAVKAYSMEILYRLSLIYPELASELSVSLKILMEDGSAGITSRGRMILKKLSVIPINPKSSHL